MYLLLGSNGHITSQLATLLLAGGDRVRIVGRSAANLASLEAAGAERAQGDLRDHDFLQGAMRGIVAAYLMIPPAYGAPDMLDESAKIGESIAFAVAASGLPRAVNLSSIGAHLPSGTGPIAALHDQEQRLNRIAGLDVVHLRAGNFFENHLTAIDGIRATGVYSDLVEANVAVPSIASADIAAVAARDLRHGGEQARNRVLHLRAPALYTPAEVASVLGAAIGRPELRYAPAEPTTVRTQLMQIGFSGNAADLLAEMARAFGRDEFTAALRDGPLEITPTRLEDFGATFKAAWDASALQKAA